MKLRVILIGCILFLLNVSTADALNYYLQDPYTGEGWSGRSWEGFALGGWYWDPTSQTWSGSNPGVGGAGGSGEGPGYFIITSDTGDSGGFDTFILGANWRGPFVYIRMDNAVGDYEFTSYGEWSLTGSDGSSQSWINSTNSGEGQGYGEVTIKWGVTYLAFGRSRTFATYSNLSPIDPSKPAFAGLRGDQPAVSDSLGVTKIEPIPEPSAMLLIITGLGGLAWFRRKLRR